MQCKIHVIVITIFNVFLLPDKDKNAINNGKHFVLFHFRRSCPEVFCKKGVPWNFTKFTGKHLCQSLFFNKIKLHTSGLLKKRLWHRCFPVNFAKFLRTSLVAASITYRNTLINFMLTLLIRFKLQNFDFQDFLGSPYIDW